MLSIKGRKNEEKKRRRKGRRKREEEKAAHALQVLNMARILIAVV